MSVAGENDCTVHIFEGEVELQGEVPEATARHLYQGDAVTLRAGKSTAFRADPRSFADPVAIFQAAASASEVQWEKWRARSRSLIEAPGLLAYFDFEDWDASSVTLPNRALNADENSHGTVIGCEKLSGRWDQNTALGFAKTSDRVIFRTTGSTSSITLMASVRVDRFPLDHNSLLSMAAGEIGEVHWKLDRSGRLLLGLRAAPALKYKSWERLESPQVVTPNDFGRWIHLATVIDGDHQEMRHFVNGREVARAPMKRRVPIRLGLTHLGNFDPLTPDSRMVRNFNGRIDEFALFSRALSAEEIAAMQ